MSKDQNIKILNDREHCLLRPGMYIGSTKPEKQFFWIPTDAGKLKREEISYIQGEYKLFCEVLDNALDEHIRGFGNQIDITYSQKTGYITIRDYGRGIPIDMHKEAKVPIPQVVFTQLKSGSNFDDSDRVTVGMNGVGASLATIFSEKLMVQIWRDGKAYSQSFSKNMEKISEPLVEKDKTTKTGTLVKFKPDQNIFSIQIPTILFHKRCLELSFMYPKLSLNLTIESDTDDCFGCNDTTAYEGKTWESFIKMFDAPYSIYEDNKAQIKMAIVHNTHTEQFEHYSNVNGADTFRGGTHIDALRDLFCEDIKTKIKKDAKLEVTNGDVAKNMILVNFQVWNAPQFEGQNKEKFVNDKNEVKKVYDDIFSSRRLTIMDGECPNIRTATIDFVLLKNEKKELLDLKKTQKNIDKKKIAKLIDCSSKIRKACSIYITEGDSAISNLATVRDSKTMAGLPLRGKVLNVFEESARDVVENKEIQSVMSAIGLKIGESPLSIINDEIASSDLSYGKIILATDQDMDGYSIRCLIINFFFKFWPEIIEHGCVYILETPLYEVVEKKTEEINYFYTKQEYETFIEGKKTEKYDISYFKGLGSCGKEAWDYMINKKPNLVQVKIDDQKKTAEKLKTVFGQDTEARKKWIMAS